MLWNKIWVISPLRLEDYIVFVLKKDAEIFLKTHLEANFDF